MLFHGLYPGGTHPSAMHQTSIIKVSPDEVMRRGRSGCWLTHPEESRQAAFDDGPFSAETERAYLDIVDLSPRLAHQDGTADVQSGIELERLR